MYDKGQATLADMKAGQTGTVVAVLGGPGLMRRLDALGIRPGRKVTKVSTTLFHGPVIIRVNSAQVALGFGMARRVVVETDRYSPRAS